MQKTANALLILTSEEREAARKFIEQRLRTLDVEQGEAVQALIQLSGRQIQHLQREKERFKLASSRAAAVMVKLYDAALAGMAGLLSECNQVLQTRAKAAAGEAGEAEEELTEEALEAFTLPCEPEEEEHAIKYLQERIGQLRAAELKPFRDSCQELLTWWESERGQLESLRFDQFGDVNSSTGRMAIRQKREELRTAVFNPFKSFFQDLNYQYQKALTGKTDPEREGGSADGSQKRAAPKTA